MHTAISNKDFLLRSVIGANPFFINLVNEKKLLSNVFSFFFARHDTQKRSEICIGCKDSAHFTGREYETGFLRSMAKIYFVEISYYPLKPTITGGVLDEWSISVRYLVCSFSEVELMEII